MRFSSDFCAASAIASPPMPRPASVVFTFIPNRAIAATKAIISITMRVSRCITTRIDSPPPLRSRPVHRMFEASVSDRAHEPRETSRQEGCQETKVVDAIQKRWLKQVDEKAVHQDRNDAPERHAKRCLPDCSERKFSEFIPDSPGQR